MSRIKINNYEIENPKIKENTRIVSLSDIHNDIKLLDEIYELLKKIKVDLICIPGDVLDCTNDKRNKDLLELLRKIGYIAKTYISLGNHDILKYGKENSDLNFFKELEKKSDCTVLKNKVESIRHNDNIVINAFNYPLKYYGKKNDERIFAGMITSYTGEIDPKSFNILLSHTSDHIIHNNKILTVKAIINEMNLILSGHNHGCLTPKFIREKSKDNVGLVGPYGKILIKNGYGYYSDEKANLIINDGVTKIAKTNELSFTAPIVNRIFIPDIDVINLKNGKNNKLTLKNTKVVKKRRN